MEKMQSREQALRLVFQQSFSPELSVEEIARLNLDADDVKSSAYAIKLANATKDNADNIDKIISDKLVKWTIERLPKVNLAILRLAVAETVFVDDGTHTGVIINAAVDFAKTYYDDEKAGFINGVLRAVAKDNEAGAYDEMKKAAAETAAGVTETTVSEQE